MNERTPLRAWHWLCLALALLLIAGLTDHFQPPISLRGGLGWDGVDYATMARQLAAHEIPRAQAPFVYRVGAPWLAGLFAPGDVTGGFLWLNICCALAAPMLLLGWLSRQGLRPGTALVLSLAFAAQWHAPLRLVPFYPVHVDPLMWVFWLGALHLFEAEGQWKTPLLLGAWVLWVLPAVAVREVLLLPALALAARTAPLLLATGSPSQWLAHARLRLKGSLLLPLATGLGLFLLIHAWAQPTQHYGFLTTALSWAWHKSPPHLLHGVGLAFGPLVLTLALLGWRQGWRRLKERQDLLVLGLGVLVLAWLGGSDTERLLYWGAPVLLMLAGLAWEDLWPQLRRRGASAWLWLGAGVLAQALSQRLLWTIPDHPGREELVLPLFTPLSSTCRYLDLWSQHARPEVQVLGLFTHVAAVAGLMWWARRLLRQQAQISP